MTHPFLPQRGEEYRALERRRQKGVDILIYRESEGQPRRHIPVSWTDLGEADPWTGFSASQSPFRWPDLLQMAALIRELDCQGDFAGGVKEISSIWKDVHERKNR